MHRRPGRYHCPSRLIFTVKSLICAGRPHLAYRAANFMTGTTLVRQFEEVFKKTQLVKQFKRGRMDRVAPKIAEEIAVLFKDRNARRCEPANSPA